MSLWSANGAASSNAPVHAIPNIRANTGNMANLFMNTTPSAWVSNQVVGVYGVTNTQVIASETGQTTGNTSHPIRFLTPGWYVAKSGMGPVAAVAINNPGGSTEYTNGNILQLTSSLSGTVNSTAVLTTNATGNVVSIGGLSNGGGMFVNLSSVTVAVTNSLGGTTGNGVGATFTLTMGGRAGRIRRECLVALPSMTSNSTFANTPLFPNI